MALLIDKIAVFGRIHDDGMISEKQMHPQRVTVWCGFWAGGQINNSITIQLLHETSGVLSRFNDQN